MYLIILFFFSSRRRHTRCLSDWSSDVCSSDLAARPQMGQAAPADLPDRGPRGDPLLVAEEERSEERRVGKECRYRWWPGHGKKEETDRMVSRASQWM